MIRILFTLDHDATAQREALVRAGLEARFPEAEFVYGAEVIEGYENAIMPLAGGYWPVSTTSGLI